jgi:hypothetical protein
MSILVIVPSRGRPDACVELGTEFHATKSRGSTRLLFALDNDDPELETYERMLELHRLHWVVNPRLHMVPTLNLEAVRHTQYYTIIGFMGDDHRPRTIGWDADVELALRFGEKSGVAYGNDLVHGPGLATAAFMTSDIIRKLGYMCPPGLIHMFADNAFMRIGEATSLTYLPNTIIEHMHPIVGKAEWSDQYAEVNGFMERDRLEFERYMRDDWPAAKEKISG